MIYRWTLTLALLTAGFLSSGCAPLVVGGAATTAAVAVDRRTAGAVIEDQAIELRVRSELAAVQGMVDMTNIDVTSYNGVVLLTGESPDESLRQRADEIARNSEKVRRVHNEIQLAAPSSYVTRASDMLITSKVKVALLKVRIEGFDPLRVKVVTENGTVYLLGLVSREEGDAATEAARLVGGVQRIVKLFEYLN
jgi:osmotically-inducible protein OsmY